MASADGLVVAASGLVQLIDGAALSAVRMSVAAAPVLPAPFVALTEKVAPYAPPDQV